LEISKKLGEQHVEKAEFLESSFMTYGELQYGTWYEQEFQSGSLWRWAAIRLGAYLTATTSSTSRI
jgi:hypothetical protein